MIILFFSSKIVLNAQGYLPVFKDVKRWCTRGLFFSYYSFPQDPYYIHSAFNDNTDSTVYVKDTVINGKTYKALRNPSFGAFFYSNVISLVREDSTIGKAWYLDSQYIEQLLYDFTLNKNDTFIINFTKLFPTYDFENYTPESGPYIVDSTYKLNVYGATRKIIYLKLIATTNHLYNRLIWIEGIGSNTIPVYLNTPALNETVYIATDNYFLHNFNPNIYKRATELVVIEKATGTLFVKPNWDCNKRRNITSGIKENLPKSIIDIKNQIIHMVNEPMEEVRVIIQNTEGKVLFDKLYYDSEINIDALKNYSSGLLILKVIKNKQVYILKYFNY